MDARGTAGEVSTAVTGGRSVSDISRSSSGSEPNERQYGGRDVERSGNQSDGLVGEIKSDNVTVGFDRSADYERNSINSEIKSDYEQMDLFNNEKDESGATGFTDEEINELLKKGSGFENGKERIYSFFKEHYNTQERAEFLAKEYGIGGEYANGINEFHSGIGITYSKGDTYRPSSVIRLTWTDVSKRIDNLIQKDEYLDVEEKQDANAENIDKSNSESQINLYKVGDFYEVYGDEAAQASEILDIKLISKVVGGEEIQMTGFPQHVLDRYTEILAEQGYEININEQAPEAQEVTDKFEIVAARHTKTNADIRVVTAVTYSLLRDHESRSERVWRS